MSSPHRVSACCWSTATPKYAEREGDHGRQRYEFVHDVCDSCGMICGTILISAVLARVNQLFKSKGWKT